MPVLGHLFAGVAIALSARRRLLSRGLHGMAVIFLTPIGVFLAYLPDIGSRILLSAGYSSGRDPGHSFLVSFGLCSLAALALRACGLRWGPALLVSVGGIAGHLGLDALQSTTLGPWWPFSAQLAFSTAPLPGGTVGELVVAAFSLAAFALLRMRAIGRGAPAADVRPISGRERVLSAILVGAIGVTALTTFWLRETREGQLERARALIESGRASQGLTLLDSADRWPSPARPGRIDYYRGVAHLKRGDRERAESCFLKAYAANPRYLWVVFDLAVFYAGDQRLSLDQRRVLAAPFIDSLAKDFPGRPEAIRGAGKARRKLGLGP